MKVTYYTIIDKDTGFIYDYDDKRKFEKALELYPNREIRETTYYIHKYIEIGLLNERGQEFEKGFDDIYEAKIFLNKLRRGHKLKIISIFCLSNEVLDELNYYAKELKSCTK